MMFRPLGSLDSPVLFPTGPVMGTGSPRWVNEFFGLA